jgi:hypothetical protein
MPSSDRDTYKNYSLKQKMDIRKRAQNRCEVCGTTLGQMSCHHLVPRRILEEICPEKMNDPCLSIYVCHYCHAKLDHANLRIINLYKQINENANQMTIFDLLPEEEE